MKDFKAIVDFPSSFHRDYKKGIFFRAMQRQQYYPGWCKLKFAELNTGWVDKLEPKALNLMAGDVKIFATSVCGGEVVARACVVKDLESEVRSFYCCTLF